MEDGAWGQKGLHVCVPAGRGKRRESRVTYTTPSHAVARGFGRARMHMHR